MAGSDTNQNQKSVVGDKRSSQRQDQQKIMTKPPFSGHPAVAAAFFHNAAASGHTNPEREACPVMDRRIQRTIRIPAQDFPDAAEADLSADQQDRQEALGMNKLNRKKGGGFRLKFSRRPVRRRKKRTGFFHLFRS